MEEGKHTISYQILDLLELMQLIPGGNIFTVERDHTSKKAAQGGNAVALTNAW